LASYNPTTRLPAFPILLLFPTKLQPFFSILPSGRKRPRSPPQVDLFPPPPSCPLGARPRILYDRLDCLVSIIFCSTIAFFQRICCGTWPRGFFFFFFFFFSPPPSSHPQFLVLSWLTACSVGISTLELTITCAGFFIFVSDLISHPFGYFLPSFDSPP